MSTPANYTFVLYQGQTWINTLALKDANDVALDLTGYTARMQVRSTVESDVVILDLSSGDGLTVTPLTGLIDILVSATDMAALPLEDHTIANWVYDLEIVSAGGVVTRVMQGAVVVYPEVTR